MLNIINLEKEQSVFNRFVAELRDVNIQTDRIRFRRNLERIGEIFAYEISKKMEYKMQEVVTPLGKKEVLLPVHQPVLSTILRAGLPLHNGLLNYFDRAENAFISAYRKYDEEGKFHIHLEYASSPDINNKILIISDPMLATASSMILTYKEMIKNGAPFHTHIVSVVASQAGIDALKNALPEENVTVWVGAIDEKLNDKSYIVPGLGDAGDLAYGEKR